MTWFRFPKTDRQDSGSEKIPVYSKRSIAVCIYSRLKSRDIGLFWGLRIRIPFKLPVAPWDCWWQFKTSCCMCYQPCPAAGRLVHEALCLVSTYLQLRRQTGSFSLTDEFCPNQMKWNANITFISVLAASQCWRFVSDEDEPPLPLPGLSFSFSFIWCQIFPRLPNIFPAVLALLQPRVCIQQLSLANYPSGSSLNPGQRTCDDSVLVPDE